MVSRTFIFSFVILATTAVRAAPSRAPAMSNWSGILNVGVPKWNSNLFTVNNEALNSGDQTRDLSAGQMAVRLQINWTFLPDYGRWSLSVAGGQDRAILEDYSARPLIGGTETSATINRAALDRQHADFGLQVMPWQTRYMRVSLGAGIHSSRTRVAQQLTDGRLADEFQMSGSGTYQEVALEIGPPAAFISLSVYMTQQRTSPQRNFMDQTLDLNGYTYNLGLGRYAF